ncbi:M16 family metallopeptidase [Sphingomicrobium arenosum]|uniref:M16 family metallopeptidase n=1 Tax=Sphingomicrobium arenosum TaxID=2233861 RepID=UPI002240FB50|nr:pitrilysin family protein [Sphingomicrobium arenosum]
MPRLLRQAWIVASGALLLGCAVTPPPNAAPAPAPIEAQAPAAPGPLVALADQVAIPHVTFTLDNGLTVIVHEDRKAPIVAVSVWYDVGSTDEPAGKTGFAHLFEHLMFNGSENLPGDYFEWTDAIGATSLNGTTQFDRTHYFQNVPTGALERILFMESDRMGYLLGAVTQDKLDTQRAVVQNEKRQRDNRPGARAWGVLLKEMFGKDHPYGHETIGSMADLDSATLGDVRQWFIDHYGPDNAVLVLAGDVDAATARPLVERYFGAIPTGPAQPPIVAEVPSFEQSRRVEVTDGVARPRVTIYWPMPPRTDPDRPALDIAGSVLGGLASSRLDAELVRRREIADFAFAGYIGYQHVGLFSVGGEPREGTSLDTLELALQKEVARLVTQGPSAEEVERAVTDLIAAEVRGLEQVGGSEGKAARLAESYLDHGDAGHFAADLAAYAALTPEAVRAAAARWLEQPTLTLTLLPGEPETVDALEKAPSQASSDTAASPSPPTRTIREIPPIGPTSALDFPEVASVRLSNGATLYHARRSSLPVTSVLIEFDAGRAAEAPDERGIAAMVEALLDEGAGGLSAQEIAERSEALGTEIDFGTALDETVASMSALTVNLDASLDLLATMLRAPDFDLEAIERVRGQLLASRQRTLATIDGVANDLLPAILYHPADPYGGSPYGDPDAIAAIDADDLRDFHARWLRPERANIFVVSDLDTAQVEAMFEQRLGRWTVDEVPAGIKRFAARPARPEGPDVTLVDRPGSSQSLILAAQILPVAPGDELTDLFSANEVFGGSFLGRINMDLREEKGWSYGARGYVIRSSADVFYRLRAPVQADRTADSLRAIIAETHAFLTDAGVSEEELARTQAAQIAELPGRFEMSAALIQGMSNNVEVGRPMDYYETLAERLGAQTSEGLDRAIRAALDPAAFRWIVVGDAETVAPQLEAAGIAFETRSAPEVDAP